MTRIRRLRGASVLLAAAVYTICAVLAYSRFPSAYSPAGNWLSDLGSARQNPAGAAFYNLGIVLTALLVLVFFAGVGDWQIEGIGMQRAMVRLTQAFGMLGCLAMLMSGLNSIDHPQHELWSVSLYVLLGTAFWFSVAALRYRSAGRHWLLALGASAALADIASGFLHEVTLLEWLTVILFLIYLLALGTRPQQRA